MLFLTLSHAVLNFVKKFNLWQQQSMVTINIQALFFQYFFTDT